METLSTFQLPFVVFFKIAFITSWFKLSQYHLKNDSKGLSKLRLRFNLFLCGKFSLRAAHSLVRVWGTFWRRWTASGGRKVRGGYPELAQVSLFSGYGKFTFNFKSRN